MGLSKSVSFAIALIAVFVVTAGYFYQKNYAPAPIDTVKGIPSGLVEIAQERGPASLKEASVDQPMAISRYLAGKRGTDVKIELKPAAGEMMPIDTVRKEIPKGLKRMDVAE